MLAGIITLSVSNWDYEFPVWFPVLVIARDIIVVTGVVVLHMLNGIVHVRPSWTGKTSTASQMTALITIMLQLNFFTLHFSLFGKAITVPFVDLPVWTAGIFTAISGFGYVVDGIAQLHDRGHGEAGWTAGAASTENRNPPPSA